MNTRYQIKQRIMALAWLRDTITFHTIRHLNSGNHARVEVLDRRCLAVEDAIRAAQREASA
jgi:hypothetical protein